MSLEDVVVLVEKEHRLYQEWLSALGEIEALSLQVGAKRHIGGEVEVLQAITGNIKETQCVYREAVSRFTKNHSQELSHEDPFVVEHILSLFESIELLQKKISQKHNDLQSHYPIQQAETTQIPIQVALDSSMDLLHTLIRKP